MWIYAGVLAPASGVKLSLKQIMILVLCCGGHIYTAAVSLFEIWQQQS